MAVYTTTIFQQKHPHCLLDGWDTRFVAPTGSPLFKGNLSGIWTPQTLRKIAPSVHHWIVVYWLVVSTPLKNISQLGWWNSQYMQKKCSKLPTSVCWKSLISRKVLLNFMEIWTTAGTVTKATQVRGVVMENLEPEWVGHPGDLFPDFIGKTREHYDFFHKKTRKTWGKSGSKWFWALNIQRTTSQLVVADLISVMKMAIGGTPFLKAPKRTINLYNTRNGDINYRL